MSYVDRENWKVFSRGFNYLLLLLIILGRWLQAMQSLEMQTLYVFCYCPSLSS